MFNIFHHWVGRVVAGLAIANIYIGLHLYRKWDKSPELGYVLYSTLLGVIVGVGVLKARRENHSHTMLQGACPANKALHSRNKSDAVRAAVRSLFAYSYCYPSVMLVDPCRFRHPTQA